jgi:hypothetical protein
MAMKRTSLFPVAALVAVCFGSVSAQAQSTEERAGARAAADQGYDAFRAGDWAAAIDRFGRAESLVHSAVHLLFLARSQSQLGQLLEAHELYLRVLREPLADTAPSAARQARADAERELAELTPQIPSVTVEAACAAATPPACQVTQDERLLPPALIGMARPVNPGAHTWRVTVSGQPPVTVTRTIIVGSQVHVQLAPAAAPVAPEPSLVLAPPASQAPLRDAPMTESTVSPWVYVGLGTAAVGFGLGTVFLLQQEHLKDEIRANCGNQPGLCPATPWRVARRNDADAAGRFAAVGFVGAGVALAGAAAAWLWSGEGPDTAQALRLQPWSDGKRAGVSFHF